MLIISANIQAAIYYVSDSDGSDFDSGLTTDFAWKTLSKVNGFTFASGDQILFKRGDTFYGSITVPRSTLTFGAYGTGNNPIISGFQTVSGWTNQGDGIYRATTAATASCNMVTVNGVNTPMGRYPNTGYLTFESFVTTTSITDTQLTNTPNWTGAEVVIKKNNWTLDRSLITNHTNSTITYTSGSTYTPNVVDGVYSYFIQNDIKTLDTFGEWYCDGTYLYMYFGAANPSSYTIKASVVDTIIAVTNDAITIENLTIEGGNIYGAYIYLCANTSISNVIFRFNGLTGIYGDSGSIITIDGCNVNNNNGFGVYVSATSTTLKNSIIDASGLFPGMGAANGYSFIGARIRSTGGLIEYNEITNSGYNGIAFYNNNFIVRYNKVDGFCSTLTDGAGIYTFIGEPTTPNVGQKVYNNIIMNGGANGLYNDNAANNIEWYNNTVINVDKHGFHSNFPYSSNIHNNVFYNTKGLSIQNGASAQEIAHDNIFSYNIVVQGEIDQTLFILRDLGTWRVHNFGTSDNNSFYVLGSLTSTAYFYDLYVSPGYNLTYRNFTDWKTLTSKEANTTLNATILSETHIAYNDTNVAKSIPLPWNAVDLNGNYKGSSIYLQPYTSMVLFYSSPTNLGGFNKARILPSGKVPINSRNGYRVMVKE